ncbi:MAG: MnmC family methyltransferase, partial [Omnitrophica WOR_2 bacterium]
ENLQGIFKTMHQLPSDVQIKISDNITFSKIEKRLQDYLPDENLKFDLVYFDAFSPVVEPDLWTEEIFKNLHSMMNNEGVLVTYCSKGVVRRTMQACNFKTERLPGPPGKHEMLRAIAV